MTGHGGEEITSTLKEIRKTFYLYFLFVLFVLFVVKHQMSIKCVFVFVSTVFYLMVFLPSFVLFLHFYCQTAFFVLGLHAVFAFGPV